MTVFLQGIIIDQKCWHMGLRKAFLPVSLLATQRLALHILQVNYSWSNL